MQTKVLFDESLNLHRALKGKIGIRAKFDVKNNEDLSLVYSPGVAAPSEAIAADPDKVWLYTMKGNTVAIVSDGSAVLGLGNIGPEAAIPVMEGKALLFKRFAGIDAFPICLKTQDPSEIVNIVKNIAPVFGGINLEDISAPRSFEIEEQLQDIGIPVFHDDQHGTAIVVLAALINACKVTGKHIDDLSVVINGAGAAGIAIARLLRRVNIEHEHVLGHDCPQVKKLTICDSHGIIHRDRQDLNSSKRDALKFTNLENNKGTLKDALTNADVFIGVSAGNLLTSEDVKTMAKDPIIFALANPIPEIMPDEALKGGAAIVGTGRSDFPNQINNVLGFPGIFRGALNARATRITPTMKLAAAFAIADCITRPVAREIIPSSLNPEVAHKVAVAVEGVAKNIAS